jgi:hypothetical protein
VLNIKEFSGIFEVEKGLKKYKIFKPPFFKPPLSETSV